MENHPLGDVADPPGQTPGYGSHSDQSTLRAVQEADENARKVLGGPANPTLIGTAFFHCENSPLTP